MKFKISEPMQSWRHPGGKLIEKGAESLSDAELLAIIISTGTKGKSAEEIADEILRKFSSYKGMANQPLNKFTDFKGLGDVKIIRIAAVFEIARRIVNQVLKENEEN
jgi:DNA repair protein RadC